MHTEQRYYQWIGIGICLCHLLAGMQFWFTRSELRVPSRWIGQFFFLLVVSCLCALVLVFSRAHIARNLALTMQVLAFLVIGYGEGPHLGVEFTLLTMLIIEISAYFPFRSNLLLTSGLILLTLVNQRPIQAWNVSLPGVAFSDLLVLGIYAGIVAAFANVLHVVVQKLDFQYQVTERLDNAVSQLIDANLGFQHYAATAGETSAVQERKRIARDIHDTAVHILVNIIMLAETAIDLIAPEHSKLADIVQQIIMQAKEAVRDTRQALRELRAIEAGRPKGLQAIQHLVKVFSASTGVQVQIDYGNLPWEMPGEIDQILYHMVQEGLTNAFRHGKATQINIRLWIFEKEPFSELIIRIHDNGQGASEIKKGIGLQGMEERIQKLQGRLEAKNVAGGFDVTAWIPLKIED